MRCADVVKLDRELIGGIDRDPPRQRLVGALIDYPMNSASGSSLRGSRPRQSSRSSAIWVLIWVRAGIWAVRRLSR
jgi:hypothetical protein